MIERRRACGAVSDSTAASPLRSARLECGVPLVPHLRAERRLWQQGSLRVVGVDEVGMGALCAPVFAAAVLVKPNCHKIPGVRDSKTLSAAQRQKVVGQIKNRVLAWGVGAASVAEIE